MPATPDQIRPDGACLLHRPPDDVEHGHWVRADPGYATCGGCLDRLRERLAEVAKRYRRLDARPGGSGEAGGRGSPGFGSRSPASDHVIALTDPRSSQVAKAWVAGDLRVHCEQENPPLSVHAELSTLSWELAEQRGVAGPDDRADVAMLVRWVDAQLDWATRSEACELVAAAVRRMLVALRPYTGDPAPAVVGMCPNTVDDGDATRECGAKLRAPVNGDVIRCGACGRSWPRGEWIRLGQLMQAAA